MKLKIEMVPKSAWNANLRSLLTQSQWDKIRRHSYKLAGHRCDICKSEDKRLSCHEVWEYDDEHNIQKLIRLEALCNKCHLCKHIGFAFTKHYEGSFNLESVIEHFILVNGLSRTEFENYLLDELDIWAERSKKEWKLDTSYLQEYTAKNNISI